MSTCDACKELTDVVVEVPANDRVLDVCVGCTVALVVGMADRGVSRFRLTPA